MAIKRSYELADLQKKAEKKKEEGSFERLLAGIKAANPPTRSVLIDRKAVKNGVAQDGPYLMNHTIKGYNITYYNDLGYKIPVYNIFHPFLAPSMDVPTWDQITAVIDILAITTALILALVATFHSAVGFTDAFQADIRFSPGEVPPAGSNVSGLSLLPYNEEFVTCTHSIGEGVNYPCFDDRIIDVDGTTVSGNYALWWYKAVNDHGESGTPIQNLNRFCVLATMTLCSALIMAVLLLGTGSANSFTSSDAPRGYQRDLVLGSYYWWLKGYLLVLVFFTVLGILFFFQTLKFLVVVKFTNLYIVENNGDGEGWPGASSTDTYGFVESIILWLIWLPCIILIVVMSKANHHAYTYPVRPWSNLSKDKLDDNLYRREVKNRLTEFLHVHCRLPLGGNDDSHGSGPSGNRFDVFLAQAGGTAAMEAEVIALVLIDAGIDNTRDLMDAVRIDNGWIRDLPCMSLGAATAIVSTCRQLNELSPSKLAEVAGDLDCLAWAKQGLDL